METYVLILNERFFNQSNDESIKSVNKHWKPFEMHRMNNRKFHCYISLNGDANFFAVHGIILCMKFFNNEPKKSYETQEPNKTETENENPLKFVQQRATKSLLTVVLS